MVKRIYNKKYPIWLLLILFFAFCSYPFILKKLYIKINDLKRPNFINLKNVELINIYNINFHYLAFINKKQYKMTNKLIFMRIIKLKINKYLLTKKYYVIII